MSEDAPIFCFSASFRVRDAAKWHMKIEQRTGLKPHHSHLKGELMFPETSYTKRWEHDVWKLNSPLGEELPLSDHLSWLWKQISPHVEFFKELINQGIHVDVFCGYRSDSDTAGFSIDPEALEIIHKLQIPLEVSVIIHSMDEG